MDLEELKFPIGLFIPPVDYSQECIKKWIFNIELFPQRISDLTLKLSNKQLNWKYRPNGWKIKQVIHIIVQIAI